LKAIFAYLLSEIICKNVYFL